MKTLRKNGGFTLVELIVVIAILAILAGVAVPAYSGYIKKANDAAALTELDALKTAVISQATLEGKTVTQIVVTAGSTDKVEVTTVPESTNFNYADFYTSTKLYTSMENSASYSASATWTAATAKWVGTKAQ